MDAMTDARRQRAEEYITRFAGHSAGVVLSQPESGVFVETPMTKGELAAREVAATISIDIFRHANQAGVCYYEIWREIAKAIDECVQAERERCARVCDGIAIAHADTDDFKELTQTVCDMHNAKTNGEAFGLLANWRYATRKRIVAQCAAKIREGK